MKVALVHDWLIRQRGGEKVFEHIARLFPEADIYTLFYRKDQLSGELKKHRIFASILQYVPGIVRFYQLLLPIFPFLAEHFDLSRYDLVISSSHCVAHGVRVRSDALHLSFCHTPMRYAWLFEREYLKGKIYAPLAIRLLRWLRRWDYEAAQRVHFFAANSKEVERRISDFYGKPSDVIHPPLDLMEGPRGDKPQDYFLIVSAMVAYKRIDLAVKAFNELGMPLKIIGTGPLEKELKAMAKPNIEFLGWVDNQELARYYCQAQALIFPGLEDFGITPLESQAAGRPVIAYGKGGVVDTVIPGQTGIFFYEQTGEALKRAVLEFRERTFDSNKIREHVLRFNGKSFDEKFSSWAEEKINSQVNRTNHELNSSRK